MDGVAGISGLETVADSLTGSGDLTLQVGCPAGKVILSGGYSITELQYRAVNSAPVMVGPEYTAWTVTMARSGSGAAATLTVFALCALG